MSDVFMSYSRLDKAFVGELRNALAEQKQDIWIDWESIPPSQAWWAEIQKGIARANNFVVVVSPNSMASPICQMEIEYARQLGKRIIPVLHLDFKREDTIRDMAIRLANPDQDATRKIWGSRQPHSVYDANDSELKHINYFYFRPDDDFATRFSALFDVIRTDYAHKEQHTMLELRALEWQRRSQNISFLLLDDELADARAWLETGANKSPVPTELQRDYIRASEQRTRQLRNVRRASVIAGLTATIAIVFAISSALIGVQANGNASAARMEVVNANETLTPIAITVEAAITQLADAVTSQSYTQNRAATADAQVVLANSDLTAIAPTLVQLADQVQVAQTSVALLELSADTLSLVSDLQIGQYAGIPYVELNGPIELRSDYNNINDLAFDCSLWSEEAGFQIYLRESPQGAVILDFQGGNLTISQIDRAGDIVFELPVWNTYSRGTWIDFDIRFISERLIIHVNDNLRLDRTLLDVPSNGAIRISASTADIFRLGRNCIEILMDKENAQPTN